MSYIERIFGYYHEDYNYSIVNKLLDKEVKKFIKNVCCFPKRLDKEGFKPMFVRYTNEEIMHIIILVTTAKTRTQIMFLAHRLYEVIKKID